MRANWIHLTESRKAFPSSICDCVFYSYITVGPDSFYTQGSKGICGPVHTRLDCKHPENFLKWVWCWRPIQDLQQQMERFRHATASTQPRSPSCIEHLRAAAGEAAESELVWSQLPTSSCSQTKQSIDPVCHFHTHVSQCWWWSLMCLCHVCQDNKCLGEIVKRYN